jgi:hypothetical protein
LIGIELRQWFITTPYLGSMDERDKTASVTSACGRDALLSQGIDCGKVRLPSWIVGDLMYQAVVTPEATDLPDSFLTSGAAADPMVRRE